MKTIENITNDIKENAFNIDFLKTHTWTQNTWKEQFNTSKQGKNFAQRVIWGFFLDNKLIASVRVNPIGSFIDEDGEEYFPHKKETIGLITSNDLSQRNANAWIEQMEQKEIVPAFHQLKGTSLNQVL